jgi:hypothetical protein
MNWFQRLFHPCRFGHQWHNEYGGCKIITWTGESECYRCGHREVRGDDPASWFKYKNGPDSWGEL